MRSPPRCGLSAQLHRESASALGTPRAVPGSTPSWQTVRPHPAPAGPPRTAGPVWTVRSAGVVHSPPPRTATVAIKARFDLALLTCHTHRWPLHAVALPEGLPAVRSAEMLLCVRRAGARHRGRRTERLVLSLRSFLSCRLPSPRSAAASFIPGLGV